MTYIKKEIPYPFFLHCCRETEDMYWKYIFEDLAYGKAPYGAYFAKGFLCCSFRGKEFSYKIDPNLTTVTLFNEVRNLLQTKLNIQSTIDRIAQRVIFDENSDAPCLQECCDWNLVKRKEVRNLLLYKYAIKKKYRFFSYGDSCIFSRENHF